MKKKTIFLTAVWIAIVCLLIFVIGGAFKYGLLEGRVLVADNGSYLIILDDHSPIKMSDCSKNGDVFFGLQTGDKIRILHDGIHLSYPGRTGVYRIRLLERGTSEDIPERVKDSLRQIGWFLDKE